MCCKTCTSSLLPYNICHHFSGRDYCIPVDFPVHHHRMSSCRGSMHSRHPNHRVWVASESYHAVHTPPSYTSSGCHCTVYRRPMARGWNGSWCGCSATCTRDVCSRLPGDKIPIHCHVSIDIVDRANRFVPVAVYCSWAHILWVCLQGRMYLLFCKDKRFSIKNGEMRGV